MDQSVRVAILGSSVVMAGVACALRAHSSLCIHIVERAGDLPHLLEKNCPDILIFDLAAVPVDEIGLSVRRHDAPILIGIDIPGRHARIFSTQTSSLATLDDLVHLLDGMHAPTDSVPNVAAQ